MASTVVMLMAIAVAGLLFGIVLQARRNQNSARPRHGDGCGDTSWMVSDSSSSDSGSSDCNSGDSGAGCDGGGGDGGGGGGGD